MPIISRDEAIRGRKLRYFTAKPCTRGHIAERYVKNCACIECLHPHYDSPERSERSRYRESKRRMIKRRFRVWPSQRQAFVDYLYSLALMREPAIEPSDIEANDRPMNCAEGIVIYAFWIFPEDEPLARAIEIPWDAVRPPQPIMPRAAAPEPAPYWPDGDPR